MKEELPAIVAEDPKRRAVRDGKRGGGSIGGQRDVFRQLLDVKVMDGRCAGFATKHNVEGLLAVEDAAGGAEL